MTKYHLVGIKGSGMSSLAQVLDDIGLEVQGSDVEKTYFTQKPLEEKGIPVLPFSAQNIKGDLCVIASAAFPDHHEEISRARELGLPVYRYYEFLGRFADDFTSIAVTGSHGKTSTTGLMSHILGQMEPTSYLIGDGTGKGQKGSEYFVFEACEYRRHFLHYRPDYAIITNIDFDHPDYFKDMDDVVDAFRSFSGQVKKAIVACGDDPGVHRLQADIPLFTYGYNIGNDIQVNNVRTDESGLTFDVIYEGQTYEDFFIPMYGKHNVLNALAVIGIFFLENKSLATVREHLRTFQGVKRRFTEKKWNQGNILIDDYAHHPAEIKATIDAVRAKYPQQQLVAIFQPHTYTRTKMFLEDFASVLTVADDVYLCDIFGSARENGGTLTIQDLLQKIPGASFIAEESVDQLQQYSNAVLLFMGAGDIQKIQRAFENHSLCEQKNA